MHESSQKRKQAQKNEEEEEEEEGARIRREVEARLQRDVGRL